MEAKPPPRSHSAATDNHFLEHLEWPAYLAARGQERCGVDKPTYLRARSAVGAVRLPSPKFCTPEQEERETKKGEGGSALGPLERGHANKC